VLGLSLISEGFSWLPALRQTEIHSKMGKHELRQAISRAR
jgi:hypothetical protein